MVSVKMEEMAEYRHMLMNFRVTELQSLLGFAGRSKSGRKHELMGRALQLLKCEGNYQVKSKIRELCQRRSPRKAPAMMPTVPQRQPPRPVPTSSVENAGVPVHPDVRLVGLPFFDHIDDLVKPTSLVSRGMSQLQELYCVFHLSPSQEELIRRSRDNRPNSKNEFTVQVQIRFCLSETSCEQEDNFPASLTLKVNGKLVSLPGRMPNNNYNCSNSDPKHQSKPINITSFCRLSSTVANHIHITWTPKYGQRHVAVVRLVRIVTSSCLIQKLKNRGYKNPDHSRALIKEKLAHDPDSEVATTSLRVSLLCPLGKTRMTLPCRAIVCNHLQCFDAALYLQMNERKTTWICPVCDGKAPLKSLVLDGLFREILERAPSCNEIVFYEDGTWRPVSDTLEQDSKKAVRAILAGSPFDLSSKSSQKAEKVPEKPQPEPVVIDLTESDSEDDYSDRERESSDTDSGNERFLSTPINTLSSPRVHSGGSSLMMPSSGSAGSSLPPPLYPDFPPFPPQLDFISFDGIEFQHPFLMEDASRINPYLFTDHELIGHTPTSSSNIIHVD